MANRRPVARRTTRDAHQLGEENQLDELIASIASFLSGLALSLMTLWTKKTPEKVDAAKKMGDAFSVLADRVTNLEESNLKQWAIIQEQRAKVETLWVKLRRVVSYALDLEVRLDALTGERHQRPPGLDEILNDK